MKKGTHVRITKFGEVENPELKSADSQTYKHGEVNEGVSLPIDYWAEGMLMESIVEGQPIRMFREVRNGIPCPGLFVSSPVTSIDNSTDVVRTHNSKYTVKIVH